MRKIGVTSRGIICPIIRKGDDLVKIVAENVIEAAKEEGFKLHTHDIVCVTESVVARSQGNYATTDDIANDIKSKYGKNIALGLIHPIYSRNRFAICLRGIARACNVIYILIPPQTDEVGNEVEHKITGVNYINYYTQIGKEENCEVKFITSTDPSTIFEYTKNILVASIHTREMLKSLLESRAEKIYTLTDILSEKSDSGYNEEYGLLGSNKVDENTVKLFPRECMNFVYDLKKVLYDLTGLDMEVGVYGDGCYKDLTSGIWEMADPVVMPGYTKGLEGTPNEVKIKYLADDKYKNLNGEELKNKIKEEIKTKESDLTGNMKSQGTTPRLIRNLVGSLCDLTSGSGDKGTPVVLIQGYFNNFSD